MNTKAIIGVVANYKYKHIKPFVESFNKDWGIDLILLYTNLSKQTIGLLEKKGVVCVSFKHNKKIINNHRYELYKKFLEKNKQYEQIILTDVRDVIFQDNPFKNKVYGLNCYLETKNYKIKDSECNSIWLKNAYGREVYNKLKDKFISCCGVVKGDYKSIMKYLNIMNIELNIIPRENFGDDTAVHNYIIYKKLMGNIQLKQNGDEVYTMAYERNFDYNKAGELYDKKGVLFPIIHQYDRHYKILKPIAIKYNCNNLIKDFIIKEIKILLWKIKRRLVKVNKFTS
jgi:hypothetical protein